MIDVCELLFSICEDENVYNEDFDLIDSGLLDSFAFILLFSKLEEIGIILYPTRIERDMLRTPRKIKKLIQNYLDEQCK